MNKKSNFMQVVIVLPTIIFLLSCSQNGNSETDYPVSISTDNGVKLVMNPDYPKFGNSEVALEEVLSIGEEDGDINHTFFRLIDITVDEQGTIYTCDYGDQRIRVFNRNGNFKYTFGRKGVGPGEFIYPVRIFINSENIVYVHDAGESTTRVTCISSKGEYIDDFKIGINERLISIDDENYLYITTRLAWDRSTRIEERSFERFDKNGKALNTITTLEGQNGTPVPRGAWNTGYEHGAINYTLTKNGDLIVGSSDKYLFSVYDRSGNIKFKFGREYHRISLTESDKSRLTKNPERRKLLPAAKPAFKMSYFRFLVDDELNFWVMTFERENEGITFDVFDEEGIYIRKVFFEFTYDRFKPLVIKNERLYAIHIDEEGFYRVKVYKLHFRD